MGNTLPGKVLGAQAEAGPGGGVSSLLFAVMGPSAGDTRASDRSYLGAKTSFPGLGEMGRRIVEAGGLPLEVSVEWAQDGGWGKGPAPGKASAGFWADTGSRGTWSKCPGCGIRPTHLSVLVVWPRSIAPELQPDRQ